jgi:hypothetical protein
MSFATDNVVTFNAHFNILNIDFFTNKGSYRITEMSSFIITLIH